MLQICLFLYSPITVGSQDQVKFLYKKRRQFFVFLSISFINGSNTLHFIFYGSVTLYYYSLIIKTRFIWTLGHCFYVVRKLFRFKKNLELCLKKLGFKWF